MISRLSALLLAGSAGIACSHESPTPERRIADVPVATARSSTAARGDDQPVMTGDLPYAVAPVPLPGVLQGRIAGATPLDSSVIPTHDLSACRPFTESLVAGREGGVADALVMLEGVSQGPPPDAPRRGTLTLERCRLEPRGQRVSVGGLIMVNGRDAMMSRLQFTPVDAEGNAATAARSTVLLSDAGQVVPNTEAASRPALIRITDDYHPWIHAWVVVTRHPFVAVTEPDGSFRFDRVPPGRYTLVVWHDRLGVRRRPVKIDGGVQTTVEVQY